MSPRLRHFLTAFILCLTPLLLLALFNYWIGIRTVDITLGAIVQDNLNALTGEIDRRVDDEQRQLTQFALSSSVRRLLETAEKETVSPEQLVPPSGHWRHLLLYDRNGKLIADAQRENERLTIKRPATVTNIRSDPGSNCSVTDNLLRCSVSVNNDATRQLLGTVAGELTLSEIIKQSAAVLETPSSAERPATVAVFDSQGNNIYQTSGPGPNTDRVIQARTIIPRLQISVAVARDRSSLLKTAGRFGIINIGLAVLLAIGATLIWESRTQRKFRGLEQVTEDVSAIAKGELDRRIQLSSSDDARALADNINVVTERLRSQIARESELHQFESFMRLSAMLTHDLKNAIEALSLIVGNMERHFENAQFRADAMRSLSGATDKLKAIVARLNRPLTSLSGEHKRPRPVDLVPTLKRVVEMTVEPQKEKYTLVLKLPPTLHALADADRIEAVIENLLLNALEAMSDGGTLTVEAGTTDRGAAMFSVGDTGPGMSKTFVENRLFHPFATTRKHGIGLGLFTCREIVQASGGSIAVESVEGVGTTFRVVLPSPVTDARFNDTGKTSAAASS